MLAIHSENEPRVLSRRDALFRTRAAGEHEFTRLLGGRSHVIVDRLTGRFGQLEPDGLPCLFLSDRGPIDCISTWSDIVDLEGDNIAATQLAIDSQIKHRQVARPSLDLQLGPDPTRRALAEAAVLPRLACPCSKTRAWVSLRLCFLDLALSHSSVSEDDNHA